VGEEGPPKKDGGSEGPEDEKEKQLKANQKLSAAGHDR